MAHNFPAPILRSFIGTPLYTTNILENDIIEFPFVQIDLADVLAKDFSTIPVKSLHKQRSNQVNIFSGRGMTETLVSCSASSVTFNSLSGRKQLSVKEYIQRIQLDSPTIAIIPADEVPLTSSWSRLGKAHQKSMAWFTQISKIDLITSGTTKLFAVAIPGRPLMSIDATEEASPDCHRAVVDSLAAAAVDLTKAGAKGIVVGGLGLGEPLDLFSSAISAVRSAVEPSIPVVVQGADSLQQIVAALTAGADLVSTNLPDILTAKRIILRLSDRCSEASQSTGLDGGREVPEDFGAKRKMEEYETSQQQVKRLRQSCDLSDGDVDPVVASVEPVAPASTLAGPSSYCITDESYERDSKPLVDDCACHACRHHSRAYVHHLVRAKELLGDILIYTHNQYQVGLIFKQANTSKRVDIRM